jgi:ParB-like chromosome segregation protein Spo0J
MTSATLSIHPLAERFPPLPPADFEALKRSIERHGLFEFIVVNRHNQVLDGRHRFKACVELGLDPLDYVLPFEQLKANAAHKLTEEEFVYESNIYRRHLTDDQRALITTEFLPFLKAQTAQAKALSLPKARAAKADKTNGSVDPNSGPQKGRDLEQKHANSTVGQLAQKAEVSRYKAGQAIDVAEGAPELAADVAAGNVTLKDAAKTARARKRREEKAYRRIVRKAAGVPDEGKAAPEGGPPEAFVHYMTFVCRVEDLVKLTDQVDATPEALAAHQIRSLADHCLVCCRALIGRLERFIQHTENATSHDVTNPPETD